MCENIQIALLYKYGAEVAKKIKIEHEF